MFDLVPRRGRNPKQRPPSSIASDTFDPPMRIRKRAYQAQHVADEWMFLRIGSMAIGFNGERLVMVHAGTGG